MEESKWKEVSKEELDAFVKAYPNKLEWDVNGALEPPLGTYNDFSDGKIWPESVVAKVIFPYYQTDPYKHFILTTKIKQE